jgi:hypothetical protein
MPANYSQLKSQRAENSVPCEKSCERNTVLSSVQQKLNSLIAKFDDNLYNLNNSLQQILRYDEPEACESDSKKPMDIDDSVTAELSIALDKLTNLVQRLEFSNRHLSEIV